MIIGVIHHYIVIVRVIVNLYDQYIIIVNLYKFQ